MAKQEEIDFQVNFKYIAPNYKLRSGAIVVKATDAEAAKKAASAHLAIEQPTAKVTSVRIY